MSKTRKDLAALTCIPCRGGIPPLAEIKVKEMIRSVPGWTWKRNEADKIEKEYTFKDFKEAMVCIFVYANRQSSFWSVFLWYMNSMSVFSIVGI